MKYDFETIFDRRGKDALAVESLGKIPGIAPEMPTDGFDAIPMWVADMNFATAPSVVNAIRGRIEHPLFGYFTPREEYFASIINWQKAHMGLRPEHIGYENGVLGGVISALNVFCQKGDKVLLHSPTYIGFTSTLENNGYKIIHSHLVKDAQGVWRMDYEDMERVICRHKIHAAIFCSPHNPTGRVWEREEIEKAMEIYRKYDVSVISDEIWSDIILPGHKHTPTQSVSEDARMRTVALYAPSKTFNLAGLVGSYHVIYNRRIRESVEKESSLGHYNEMNILSMYGLIGAYSDEGSEWMEELRQVIGRNVDFACGYIKERFDGVEVAKPEGTYMLFPDCSRWCAEHGMSMHKLERECWKVGVALQDGRIFHGNYNVRINLALPFSRVEEAFDRLDKYVFNAGKR